MIALHLHCRARGVPTWRSMAKTMGSQNELRTTKQQSSWCVVIFGNDLEWWSLSSTWFFCQPHKLRKRYQPVYFCLFLQGTLFFLKAEKTGTFETPGIWMCYWWVQMCFIHCLITIRFDVFIVTLTSPRPNFADLRVPTTFTRLGMVGTEQGSRRNGGEGENPFVDRWSNNCRYYPPWN